MLGGMGAYLGWIPGFIRNNLVTFLIGLIWSGLAGWLGIELTGGAPGDPPMPWQVRVMVVIGVIASGGLAVYGWWLFRDWWIGDKRLAISCEEIVIGGVGVVTAKGGPPSRTWPGTYIVARGFQVTNRSPAPVVLSINLRVKMRDGWQVAKPRGLPFDPGAFDAHHDFLSLLSESELAQPVNLDPTHGASGRITFYLGFDVAESHRGDDLSSGEMLWGIHDSQSSNDYTLPVVRTQDRWRVLLSRFHGASEKREPPAWLSVEIGELVLIPAFNADIASILGGEHIPSGMYVVLENVRSTNLTAASAALVPTLWRRLGDSEWSDEAVRLPDRVSDAPLAYGSLIRYLGGNIGPIVNLGPGKGDAGRLAFRLSAGKRKLDDLQRSDFRLEMHDSHSGQRLRQLINRPAKGWRVDK
jgi:hypothetical protein